MLSDSRRLLAWLGFGFCALCVATSGQAQTFDIFNVPGSTYTAATGINDTGQIVGYSDVGGFLDVDGAFTGVNAPGATATYPNAINNAGQIVGYYTSGGTSSGFLDTGGVFSAINVPGATGGTFAQGINNAGQIVGYYVDGTGTHGFVDTGGVFVTLDVAGSADTFAEGINDAGQVVGYAYPASMTSPYALGFVDTAGLFSTIDAEGGSYSGLEDATYALGINDAGQVVGDYIEGARPPVVGFVDDQGSFAFVNVSPGTEGYDHGTVVSGINNAGQLVGYFNQFQVYPGLDQGFSTAVPEPPTGLLLGLGAAALVALTRTSRSRTPQPKACTPFAGRGP
jgi:uncharacterized membrane protein